MSRSSQQLFGVVGDLEEPLLEVAALDEVARALAGPVGQHLLVGEHRAASGTPVDRRLGAVRQTGLEEREEDGLGPAHVLGVVAADLAAPVVDRAEAQQRGLQFLHPRFGEDPRVAAGLDGGVLGGEAEGVETERREDGLAEHGLVAHDDVAEGVDPHVALVGGARGIRVHGERVVALAGVVVVDFVRALVEPAGLPLLFYFRDIKRPRH